MMFVLILTMNAPRMKTAKARIIPRPNIKRRGVPVRLVWQRMAAKGRNANAKPELAKPIETIGNPHDFRKPESGFDFGGGRDNPDGQPTPRNGSGTTGSRCDPDFSAQTEGNPDGGNRMSGFEKLSDGIDRMLASGELPGGGERVAGPIVQIDTREQRPLAVHAFPTERVGLPVGDYGLKGFSDWNNPRFILERKSLPDLVASLTSERERFWKECEKMRQFAFRGLLIEGLRDEINLHTYRGLATPQSLLASVDALCVRCGIHIFWAGDCNGAASLLESLLRQFIRGIEKDYRRLAA
jgi:hypothetical protein